MLLPLLLPLLLLLLPPSLPLLTMTTTTAKRRRWRMCVVRADQASVLAKLSRTMRAVQYKRRKAVKYKRRRAVKYKRRRVVQCSSSVHVCTAQVVTARTPNISSISHILWATVQGVHPHLHPHPHPLPLLLPAL
jgi:hypothetical protein